MHSPSAEGPTAAPTLTAAGGILTGGFFKDPVTNIVYTCEVDGATVTFVDSNNGVYPIPGTGTASFVARSSSTRASPLAVDSAATRRFYPILNNQFVAGSTDLPVNVPVAYENAAGPVLADRRRPLHRPQGSTTVQPRLHREGQERHQGLRDLGRRRVLRRWQCRLHGQRRQRGQGDEPAHARAGPPSDARDRRLYYALDAAASTASTSSRRACLRRRHQQFTVSFNGSPITYTLAPAGRHRQPPPGEHLPGHSCRFAGHVHRQHRAASRSPSTTAANNPVTAAFVYVNHFFIDALSQRHLLRRRGRRPCRGHVLPAGDHAIRVRARRRRRPI